MVPAPVTILFASGTRTLVHARPTHRFARTWGALFFVFAMLSAGGSVDRREFETTDETDQVDLRDVVPSYVARHCMPMPGSARGCQWPRTKVALSRPSHASVDVRWELLRRIPLPEDRATFM